MEAMREFSLTIVIIAGIFTALAIIGIWAKDREEFFGIGGKTVKVKFSDYISVLKRNRPLQILVVSAASDKLALNTAKNSTVMVMLYGIVMGNFGLYGIMFMVTMLPTFLIIMYGTKFASKFGSKKALVSFTWIIMILYAGLFLILFLGDPTQISLENIGVMTILWLVVFSFIGMPMIGWVCTLVAMKFYELDDKKIEEIQRKISDMKKGESRQGA